MSPERERWSHNIHYHPMILDAVPDGCQRALDIGCGEGMLSRELRRLVPHVTAIDIDVTSIQLARQRTTSTDIEYVLGDFPTHPFEPASFELVVSVAALHHMEATTALDRMRTLLRPGGVLALVGLARHRFPADLPFAIAGAIGARLHKVNKTCYEGSAPTVWPPPETFGQTRRTASRMLPGVRYRRHLLWRYSLVWTKPTR